MAVRAVASMKAGGAETLHPRAFEGAL